MNWLNTIFVYFFGTDSKFFLIGAWLTSIFMMIGQLWALIGTGLAALFVYYADKQIYGEWAIRDMKCVVLGALVSLIFGLFFIP